MALGALHTNAEENLTSCFSPIITGSDDKEVGRAIGIGASDCGKKFACEIIHAHVVAEDGTQPVVLRPHAFFL